jgi:hypothetical protein
MADRPIPRDWNSRVTWLLEHLLGGALPIGTGDHWPQGGAASPVLLRVRVALGAATEYALQLPIGVRHWSLRGFSLHRTGGAAATMAPTLGQVATWSAGGVEERMTYGAQVVGTPISDVLCSCVPVRTDANGKLWFRPGFDAGVNNTGTAEFWFEQAIEALGST